MDQSDADLLKAAESVRILFENFYRIRDKLSNRSLTISKVTGILNLTKRQVSYWNLKWLQRTDRHARDRTWQKFAIIDLLGFAVVKKLRGFGVKVDRCIDVFDLIRKGFLETNPCIYNFAIGDPVVLVVDMDSTEIALNAGLRDEEDFYKRMISTPTSVIIMPIGPLLKIILEKTKETNFYIEYVADKSENKWKVAFYVDGERIEFERWVSNSKKRGISVTNKDRNSDTQK